VLLPAAAAVGASTFVGPDLYRPSGAVGLAVWVLQIASVSTATVLVVDRFARRLLPLASLLGLSLVFPDEAPSRFGVALRSGTAKRLREQLDDRRPDETTSEAATRLLRMVHDLNEHDRLTRGHTERVRAYSELIAEQLELDDESRWKLRWATLVHDIGKLTVPPEVLNSTGRPTDEEWAILRGHPAAGAAMVEPLADWLGDWRLAAGQHHERWDGTGYPNGLAGEEISLAGRIVAVADAYDVITSARSYKKPMEPKVAREELVRCAGTQFDPQVVRAFLNVSLGRLRLIGGPLAWLASIPLGSNVGATIASAAGNVAVAASVVVGTVAAGAVGLPAAPIAAASAARPSAQTAGPLARHSGGNPRPVGGGHAGGSQAHTTSTSTSVVAVPPPGNTIVAPSGGAGAVRPPTSSSPSRGVAPPPATAPPRSSTTTTTTTRPAVLTAVADSYTSPRHKTLNMNVLANDKVTGVLIDWSSLAVVSGPTGPGTDMGTVTVTRLNNNALLSYATPDAPGTFSLVYRICDTAGRCSQAGVTVTLA
jgi:hypothetical protein